MTLIDATEKKDFLGVLKEYGCSSEHFDLTESYAESTQHTCELVGFLWIFCKQSGVEIRYTTGHGSAWVVDFATNLELGKFGKMQ
ncbi:MAG: hypothetical protein QUV35_15305 [Hydrogenophaga sp.]|uniref:hypothetical protein n=1 Tax=Hydrogenophaga sp. TaxID=1904254 RepID=UPI00261EEC37|nr:hypothetical protein [Hydrogenophaga sp.]MDM7943990.1 hypothetical protein [Hydrogenophaga sp.]